MKQLKTISLILIAIALLWSSIIIIKKLSSKKDSIKYRIGILQTASHPALDAAKNGFIGTIKKALGENVLLIEQNAEGNVATAHAIAQRFHAQSSLDALFAIATPAAQALAAVEKEKPIVLAAVTDPHALGIIKPDGNVTGSSDMIDVPGQIALVQKLVPHAKKIALLYNNAEINSKTMAQKLSDEIIKSGLTPFDVCISNEADIITAVQTALRNADVILTPTDNLVACAISMIAKQALAAKKPLIVSDNMLIKFGPLASRGVDYHESGIQAAQMILEMLVHGKNIKEMPLRSAKSSTIFINKKTLAALKLSLPQDLEHVTFTEFGFLLHAVGQNPQMLINLGKKPNDYIALALIISNMLTALSGALFVQYTGYFSIWANVGILITSLIGLMLAELITSHFGLALIFGAIIYQAIITVTFELHIDQDWNKFINALLIIALMAFNQWKISRSRKGNNA